MRQVGLELGLPEEMVFRQPFPGPGLAIRIIGEVTPEKLEMLRACDWIVMNEIKKAKLYRELWQAFAVLTDSRSVGVMGDFRTYGHVVALRARDGGGRDDRGLGAPALRPAGAHREPHRERGARRSTAWSTTSRRSRQARLSGSSGFCGISRGTWRCAPITPINPGAGHYLTAAGSLSFLARCRVVLLTSASRSPPLMPAMYFTSFFRASMSYWVVMAICSMIGEPPPW